MATHTPTPWARDKDYVYRAGDRNDLVCALLSDKDTRPVNGDLIVRAVNCHDDLLAALKLAEDCISALVDMTEGRGQITETSISKPGVTIRRHVRQVLPELRAAIAKAEP